MKLSSKLMLSAFAVALSVPVVASTSQAAEAKLYGNYTAALVNTSDKKVDGGLQKTESFTDFSSNTYSTNKLGVNFKLDDNISGQVEAKIPSGEGNLTARKYFVTVAIPNSVSLTVGRHNTLFGEVAGAADNLTLGADGGRGGYVAGVGYFTRNEGVTLRTPALGGVVLAGSVQKAANPGGNDGDATHVKQTKSPALEASATLETKAGALGLGAALAYHQEAVGIAAEKEETASAYAGNAWLGNDKFKVVGIYSHGDPLFANIANDTAVYTKDMEDTLTNSGLWGQVSVTPEAVLAGYWGNEVAKHKAQLKGQSDIEDKATTVGLNGTYTWKGVGFFAEYASTERKKDGILVNGKAEDAVKVRDVNSFGLGVNVAWGE